MVMKDSGENADFFADLRRELSDLRQTVEDQWYALTTSIRNQLRELRRAEVDYVFIPVGGTLPERDPPPRGFIERQLPLPPPAFSMQALNRQFQAIADADNVKGVVIVFRGFEAGLATLQNFRRAVQRLREAGKEAIVFTPYLDLAHYYAATAADQIIVPPSTQFNVLGLRAEITYLKDALNRIGIEAEAFQTSPYKSAPNVFSKSDMTPEERQQLNWRLDDWFDIITTDMAAGRRKDQEEIQRLIDQAPYFAEEALTLGLVDHLAYEDELAYLLADEKADTAGVSTDADDGEEANQAEQVIESVDKKRRKAKLLAWRDAHSLLMEKSRRHSRKFIGVISLEGTIIMGPSRRAPFDLPIPIMDGNMAGEQTLVRLLRQAEKSEKMAALIFLVDSGGGSSLASDLIGRQIERINRKKPVLAYMGNVAASGGYYIVAPASHVMSQSGTITGSIGVWTLHLTTRDLYGKININRVNLDRGKRAGLYSDVEPLTEEQRQIFAAAIDETYDQFKQVVANGRKLPYEELDPICEGRVWTGRQALGHKLLDSQGDFVDAVHKAAELAGLPLDDDNEVPVVNFFPGGGGYVPPKAYDASEAVAEMGRWLFGERLQQLVGQPLLMMPYQLKLK